MGLLLTRTRLGLAMRALAASRAISTVIGVPVVATDGVAWLLSGIFAGAVGLLLSVLVVMSPIPLTFLIIPALAAAILGGLSSLPGALAGGLVCGLSEAMLTGVPAAGDLPQRAALSAGAARDRAALRAPGKDDAMKRLDALIGMVGGELPPQLPIVRDGGALCDPRDRHRRVERRLLAHQPDRGLCGHAGADGRQPPVRPTRSRLALPIRARWGRRLGGVAAFLPRRAVRGRCSRGRRSRLSRRRRLGPAGAAYARHIAGAGHADARGRIPDGDRQHGIFPRAEQASSAPPISKRAAAS